MDVLKKTPVREQDPKVRATNFEEVCLGYNREEAMEAVSYTHLDVYKRQAFVSDKEVSDVVEFLKNQQLGNIYDSDIQQKMESMGAASGDGTGLSLIHI